MCTGNRLPGEYLLFLVTPQKSVTSYQSPLEADLQLLGNGNTSGVGVLPKP